METLELCRNDFGLWVVKAGRVEERKCKDKLGEVLGSKKKKKILYFQEIFIFWFWTFKLIIMTVL